jgi:hypothetical protein
MGRGRGGYIVVVQGKRGEADVECESDGGGGDDD